MEIEIPEAGGDDSLDSIPRPEYESIEGIKKEEEKECEGAILNRKHDKDCKKANSVDSGGTQLSSVAEGSHSQSVIPMEEDLNESVEGTNDAKMLQNVPSSIDTTTTTIIEIAAKIATDSTNAPIQIVPQIHMSTSTPTQPKLVQAKTKDNKVVLVQLVDENGKTFRSTNKNTTISTSNTELNIISPIAAPINDEKQIQQSQPRSSTPLSREYLALQKSVNNSKILTEFVTDTSMEKARKRKSATINVLSKSNAITSSNEPDSPSKLTITNDSTTKQRRRSNSGKIISIREHVTADNPVPQSSAALAINEKDIENDTLNTIVKLETSTSILEQTQNNWLSNDILSTNFTPHKQGEKLRKSASSKFVPLKDESNQSECSGISVHRRSRSQSVNPKSTPYSELLHSTQTKFKKWPSDEKMSKRTNMRSQNSDFVQKQIDFLNRVIHQNDEHDDDYEGSDTEEQHSILDYAHSDGVSQTAENSLNDTGRKGTSGGSSFPESSSDKQLNRRKSSNSLIVESQSFEKYLEKIWLPPPKPDSDSFCWKCRQCLDIVPCSKCVRSFHPTCVKVTAATKLDKNWVCPECLAVENVLNGPKRTRRNELSLDLLSQLLSFALKRMRNVKGLSQFQENLKNIPNFPKYFVNPVTFATLQEKIEKKAFRCAEEFVNETKWLHHNALLAAAGTNSKDSSTAKAILKICRQEAIEIDTCAECYLNANTRSDWFVDVCSQPHLLLWAKLKGFPYWPAKAMGFGQGAHVNVRFFGEHDRAFVPSKDCYLYSEHVPNAPSKKSSRAGFAECLNEVKVHIEKIKQKIGGFNFAPYKTLYEPAMEIQQLEIMMPGVQDYIKKQQLATSPKPPLQYKIVKSADNHLSIIKKTNATDSGTESDHSLGVAVAAAATTKETVTIGAVISGSVSSPGKKKVAENSDLVTAALSADHNKIKNVATSNYEVITKITNDDSKNPKVSTVILKRKSDQISDSKNKSDDITEMQLPKMTKIEEDQIEAVAQPVGVSDNTKIVAEKTAQEQQNHKVKHHHSKPDPKVPILTIKTNTNTTTYTNTNTNANKTVEAKEISSNNEIKIVPDAQNAVENLVKFKQGVTIKKINKDEVKKKPSQTMLHEKTKETHKSDSANLNNAVEKPKAQTHDEKSQKNAMNKSKQTQIQNQNKKTDIPNSSNSTSTEQTPQQLQLQKEKLILKDLVPFVEIKKEVTSDDEENYKDFNNIVAATTTDESPSNQTILPNPVQPQPIVTTPVDFVAATQSQPAQATAQSTNVLLTAVKQEVMSDNEDGTPNIAQLVAEKSPATIAEKSNPPTVPDSVRVVGDTTIQRISSKIITATITVGNNTNSTVQANPQAPQQGQNSQNATPLTGTIFTNLPQASSHTSNALKRNTVRGVPYGPLPASATPAATKLPLKNVEQTAHPNVNLSKAVEKQLLQQQLQQQLCHNQRARKSFPNRSPPEVSPVRCIATPLLQISPIASPAIGTVVSAPAGVVSIVDPKRTLTKTSMVSIPVDVATNRGNSAIPVPPLTAVTKITPTSTVANAVVVSSLPASTTSVASSTFVNCNGATTIGCTVTSSQHTIGASTGMTMSVPPPLAGLSYNTFTAASSLASVTSASTATSTSFTSPLSSSSVQIIANGQTLSSDVSMINNSTAATAITTGTNTADTHLLGDFVTPSLASAITEVICRGPPRLAPRPSGPLQSDGSTMFPSQAGPVCRTLVENAHKLADFFISVMEDTMCEMSVGDDSVLQAKITLLTMELERTKQTYEREIAELKRTSDLMLCEMRKSMDNEKTRIAAEVRKQCELERLRSVEETKKKQWCANCGREAQFYCCWNTSYCDYPCQQLHWGRHAASCAQTRSNEALPGNSVGCTSSVNTTNQAENSNMHHRHHGNSKSSSTNATAHYNSKTVISNKKDKSVAKSGSVVNNAMTSSVPSAEVLKLPSNTYLRPVAANSTNVRATSYPSQLPVQRFNIPLPIAAPANPGLPYTLVQREGNWELLSAASSTQTTTSNATMPATNVTATLHQQPQHQQPTRLLSSTVKSSPRCRVGGNNTSVTMQSLSSNMNTPATLQCGTVRPTTHM